MEFKPIALRIAPVLAPVGFLAIGFIAVHRLDAAGAMAFVRIMTISQLLGSLPGIGLGLFLIAHQGDWGVRSEVEMLGSLLAFTGIVALLTRNGWVDGLLILSSFIGSFYDTYAKSHLPTALPLSRLAQALVAGVGLAVVLSVPVGYGAFVALRAIGNLVVCPFLVFAMLARPRDEDHSKVGFNTLGPALLSYAWMAGSNLIFLFPSLMGSYLFVSRAGALTTYALQTSLQLGGRLSDYLTVNRLNGRLPHRREMAAALAGSMVVFLLLFRPMAGPAVAETALKVAFSAALAISVACWGWGDMLASCRIYRRLGPKQGLFASLVGFAVAGLVALCAWPASAAGQPQLSQILLVLAAGVGATLYLFASKGRLASL